MAAMRDAVPWTGDELLRDELHIPVFVADNALRCVAEGTGILLENLHLVK